MNKDFNEDLFVMLAELALEYAQRRLKGDRPKLKVHFEFEDETSSAENPNSAYDVRAEPFASSRTSSSSTRVWRKAVR
jgi:hypothetical protein